MQLNQFEHEDTLEQWFSTSKAGGPIEANNRSFLSRWYAYEQLFLFKNYNFKVIGSVSYTVWSR